jgi:hypothetical protein
MEGDGRGHLHSRPGSRVRCHTNVLGAAQDHRHPDLDRVRATGADLFLTELWQVQAMLKPGGQSSDSEFLPPGPATPLWSVRHSHPIAHRSSFLDFRVQNSALCPQTLGSTATVPSTVRNSSHGIASRSPGSTRPAHAGMYVWTSTFRDADDWTECAVEWFVSENVPEGQREAARAAFVDPIVWGRGTAWLGNGQHRALALWRSGVDQVLVVR